MKKSNVAVEHRDTVALPWYEECEIAVRSHPLVMLVGKPGCGKSRFADWISRKHTGLAPVVTQGTPNMERYDFWGSTGLKDGATEFIDGRMVESLKSNRFMVIDDWMAIPPEVRGELLPLRASDTVVNPLSKEEIKLSASWRLLATTNPESARCRGNAAVARALLDGFVVCEIPDMTTDMIADLLHHNFPDASKAMVDAVMDEFGKFRRLLPGDRDSGDATTELSYRAAEQTLKLLLGGMRMSSAVKMAMIGKYILDEDLHRAAKLKADFAEAT